MSDAVEIRRMETPAAAVVRMELADQDALDVGRQIREAADDIAQRLRDQLWLRQHVLLPQRIRTVIAERAAFDERADRILDRLDP